MPLHFYDPLCFKTCLQMREHKTLSRAFINKTPDVTTKLAPNVYVVSPENPPFSFEILLETESNTLKN